MEQQIQFVTAPDGVSLAVATMGAGTPLVIVPGWISHLELEWQFPANRDFFTRLAENHLLVRYDKRGTGLSDRNVDDFSPEANLRDLEAITNALGLQRPALLGYSQGGPIAIAYSAERPDAVSSLILYGSYHDGTTAYFHDLIDAISALVKVDWGFGATAVLEMFVPGAPPEARQGFAEFQRQAADSNAAFAIMKSLFDFRVTDLLPEVRVPTLVVHRRGDKACPFQQGREMAARIPGARFIPLDGDIHVIALGDIEPLVVGILEFLGGAEGPTVRPRISDNLQTILFTDMEDSTALTQRLGDAAAQELVRAHNDIVRTSLELYGGAEIKHTGDGIMATFPSASRAITCALGMQMGVALRNNENPETRIRLRVGLNAGEPVAEENDLFGTTVQLAARICAQAGPGQVLVSDVVRQLAAGKGFAFADQGEAELKGFAEPHRLYAASRT